MKYNFDINNRAFNAIKNKTKRVEIRTTKLGANHFDYRNLKTNDIIEFKSYDGNIINCVVEDEPGEITYTKVLTKTRLI